MPNEKLRFDPETHSYWLGGEKLISVTTVLREAKLFDYTSFHGMYMDRGTAVHTITELSDKGALVEDKVENPLLPYLDAWKKFREDTQIEVLATEEPVYHPIYKYAGMLDRRILWKKKEAVIDIKSGMSAPWHHLQTAAYAKTFNRPMLRFSLYISGEGTYHLEEHSNYEDWDVFRSALAVVNWKRKMGALKI